MRIVIMDEARSNLSLLVEQAAAGEPFVIAKAGKPVVKVTAVDTPVADPKRRVGFMKGQIMVPDDFDRMGSAEIEETFGERK